MASQTYLSRPIIQSIAESSGTKKRKPMSARNNRAASGKALLIKVPKGPATKATKTGKPKVKSVLKKSTNKKSEAQTVQKASWIPPSPSGALFVSNERKPIARTDEVPEKDPGVPRSSLKSVGIPLYNERLSSSTPIHIPAGLIDSESQSEKSRSCDADSHALNSLQFTQAVQDPVPTPPQPLTIPAQVQFVPKPGGGEDHNNVPGYQLYSQQSLGQHSTLLSQAHPGVAKTQHMTMMKHTQPQQTSSQQLTNMHHTINALTTSSTSATTATQTGTAPAPPPPSSLRQETQGFEDSVNNNNNLNSVLSQQPYRPIQPFKIKKAGRGGFQCDKENECLESSDQRKVLVEACVQTPTSTVASEYVEDLIEPTVDSTQLTAMLKKQIEQISLLIRQLKRENKCGDKTKKLCKQVENSVLSQLNVKALQTEWDLSVQPLRKENVDLRRRVRILQQMLKAKEEEVEMMSGKSKDLLEAVSQRLILRQLEKQLEEERESGDRLRRRLANMQQENHKFVEERKQLLQVMANRRGYEHGESEEKKVMQKQISDLKKDKQMLTIELVAKDKEIVKTQQLVSGLQESMTTLLAQLSKNSPPRMAPPHRNTGPAYLSTAYPTRTDVRHDVIDEVEEVSPSSTEHTQYLRPAGMSPLVETFTSPTVQQLLKPIAEQMNQIHSESPAKRVLEFAEPEAETVSTYSSDSNVSDEPTEADTTLTSSQTRHSAAAGHSSVDQSRYSVTDYLNKYQASSSSGGPSSGGPSSGGPSSGGPSSGGPSIGGPTTGGGLFTGTALDTSLSTINDDGLTVDTFTSVDDRKFQEGLRNLDANIAKLQLALREDALSSSQSSSDN